MTDFIINNSENKYDNILQSISINSSKPNYDSQYIIKPTTLETIFDFNFEYLYTNVDNLNYDTIINIDLFNIKDLSKNKYKYQIYTIEKMYEYGGVVTIYLLKDNNLYQEYKLLSNNNSISFIIIDENDTQVFTELDGSTLIENMYSSINVLNRSNTDYITSDNSGIYVIDNDNVTINLDNKNIYINNSLKELTLNLYNPNNSNFNNKDNTIYTFQILNPYSFNVTIKTYPLIGSFILNSSNSTIYLSYINNIWVKLKSNNNSSYITNNIYKTIKEDKYKSIGYELCSSKDCKTIAFSSLNSTSLSSSVFVYKLDTKIKNLYKEISISSIIANDVIIENFTNNTKVLLSADGNTLYISNINKPLSNNNSVIYSTCKSDNTTIVVGKDSIGGGFIAYSENDGNWVKSDTGSNLFNLKYKEKYITGSGEGLCVAYGLVNQQGTFVVVGKDDKNGVIGYSINGRDWIKSDSGNNLFGVGGVVYSVCWSGNKFVATGKTKTKGLIIYSFNGIYWLKSLTGDSLLGKGNIGYSINLCGNVLNVSGSGSIIGTSLNGIDWYKQTSSDLYGERNNTGVGYGLAYSNSTTIIVGKYIPNNNSVYTGIVGYINNNGNWVKSDTGSNLFNDGEARSVAYGVVNEGRFVAVGKDKSGIVICYSDDNGINWTKLVVNTNVFGVDCELYNVNWDGSKFVALGKNSESGVIFESDNGESWTKNTNSLFSEVLPLNPVNGKVCVYKRNNNGKWDIKNLLVISSNSYSPYFGVSLSLSCDELIIGDTNGNSHKGCVYIFNKDGNNQPQIILPETTTIDSKVGNSISISPNGDILVIGGSEHNSKKGSIWVYIKNTENNYENYLKNVNKNFSLSQEEIKEYNIQEFGCKVLISPDFKNIIVSSKKDKNINDSKNKVFIYEIRNNDCYLIYVAEPDETYDNDFGKTNVMTGDSNILIIGSPSLELGKAGYIYIYKKEYGLWSYFKKYNNLKPSQIEITNSNMLYGSSLSLQDNGNLLLVGVPTDDYNSFITINT